MTRQASGTWRLSDIVVLPGRLRWRLTVVRAAIVARMRGGSLTVLSGRGVSCGSRVRIDVRGTAVLEVGQGCWIRNDVSIEVGTATVRLGPSVELRPHVVLRVGDGARLELGGDNMLSYGTVVHAAGTVTIGSRTAAAEYVTIIDSNHELPLDGVNFRDSRVVAPVVIGDDVWIGSKATVIAGVTVGNRAVIGGSAVVTRDVAEGSVVAGVPARALER